MSADLYQDESLDRVSNLAPVQVQEAGAFDGFLRGSGMAVMKGFAKTARAIDMAGAALPIAYDAITGGTEAQDRYFKEHDELGDVVDFWTPKPNEVGAAADIVGGLLSTLPVVMAAPSLAVASAQLSASEDLARRGVPATKAIAAGAVEGAALGTGIWMPILGNNLWQRVALGGAGFNVAQGIVARSAEGMILEGTPEAEQFKAFDAKAMTLDALMGAAFGVLTHINPAARAQGKETWEKITAWAEKLNPSDVDSILVLRQAQHLNEDSAPGKPLEARDIEAHVQKVRAAIDDISAGRDVQVDDMPVGKYEPDAVRFEEAKARADDLVKTAEAIRKESGLPKPQEDMFFHGTNREFDQFDPSAPRAIQKFEDAQGFYFSRRAEDASTYAVGEGANVRPVRLDYKNPKILPNDELPPSYITPKARAELEAAGYDAIVWRGGDEVVVFKPEQIRSIFSKTEGPQATARVGTPPVEGGGPARPEVDPIAKAADSFAESNKDLKLRVGTDADGAPVHKTVREFIDGVKADVAKARDDVKLFAVAAECMLGLL